MSDDLVARVERLADVASRRGGCDRVYRLAGCRSRDEWLALWERAACDDPFIIDPAKAIIRAFGKGAVGRVEVFDHVDGVPFDFGGVPFVEHIERRAGLCWWGNDEGGDGRG